MEENINEEDLIDISKDEAPQRPTILEYWMDEFDPAIAFHMKRRLGWSNEEFAILKKELNFLKLNREFEVASLECKIEMVNNLVKALE